MPQGFGSLVAARKRKRASGEPEDDFETSEKANPTTIEPIRRRRSAKQAEDDDDAEMLLTTVINIIDNYTININVDDDDYNGNNDDTADSTT
jgi:hypothetical protein